MNTELVAINNINDYASASQNWESMKMEKLQLIKPVVLYMKKIQSFEIEYFNKFGETGFACTLMTFIIKNSSPKTWPVLGKEVVNLLKYWLDALRKHLIDNNSHWWAFMEVLMKFINDIRQKHSTLPEILVEQTAECFFDLSTNEKCDEYQKLKILQCFNMYCAESSKEIRFAMRNHFSNYFVKLAIYMSTCGLLPCQFLIMETLLRWMVPRQNVDIRSSSAKKWFPEELFCQRTVDIFLKSDWIDFFQDARDFLNALNEGKDKILSLICRKLSIGHVEIIYGAENRDSWLDINTTSSCMTVLLDPQMLVRLGVKNHRACEILIIKEQDTSTVQLSSESKLITISVTTLSTPQLYPSSINIVDEGIRCVRFVVSSRSDLVKLDKALREIYGDKYRLTMDLKRGNTQPPQQTSQSSQNIIRPAKLVRFSQPIGKRRGRRSGYVLRSRNPAVCNLLSTSSTTSLVPLYESLAPFPKCTLYATKSRNVCKALELTKVIEASETDKRQTLNSVTEFQSITKRLYGVSHKSIHESSIGNPRNHIEVRTDVTDKSREKIDHSTSCLLIATIGSTDDSVISNTKERLLKNKECKSDNLVDLLIKEALQTDIGERNKDINSDVCKDANKQTPDIDNNNKEIVNTNFAEQEVTRKKQNKKTSRIRNKSSSTDDSHANIINDTPVNRVQNTTKDLCRSTKSIKNLFDEEVLNKVNYDEAVMHNFVAQHFVDNPDGKIVISPTLAMELKKTSSEVNSSICDNIMNEFSSQKINHMLDDLEVRECLNSIIDKVCNDFQKYTKYLNPKNTSLEETDMITNRNNYEEEQTNGDKLVRIDNNKMSAVTLEQNNSKPKYNLQLKFPAKLRKDKCMETRSVTRSSNNKKDDIDTHYIEHDDPITNDESKKPSKRNIKRTYNKKKKNNAKKIDNLVNNTKIYDDKEIENVTRSDDFSTLNEKKSQQKETEKAETPATVSRRKRKLYSPIIENSNNDLPNKQVSDGDENMLPSNSKVKSKTLNSNAISYKDIEKERRNYIRRPRNLSSKSKVVEISSPRSRKLNEMFDKLKETVENNNNEIFVDPKSVNTEIYNFTSDSEDEDFKPKKIYTPKQTLLTDNANSASRRGKITKTTANPKNKTTKTAKTNKVAKKKPNKRKISIPIIDLTDQRMRQANTDVLNTSLIIDKQKNVVNDHPVPVLSKIPQLEDYTINDKEIQSKKNINTKSSEIKLPVIHHKALSADRTESPLPELIIETITSTKDYNCDSIRPDMLESMKKIYLNDTNTTTHQLLDEENMNQNEQSSNDNIQTDVIDVSKYENLEVFCNNPNPRKSTRSKNELNNIKLSDPNKIEVVEIPECCSDKSIATIGITAHGSFDESPPNMKHINQQVSPRNLETEDLGKTLQDYFNNLESRLNQSGEYITSSKPNTPEQRSSGNSVEKIPYVSLSRLPIDNIENTIKLDESLSQLTVKTHKTLQQHKKSKASGRNISVNMIPGVKSTPSNRPPISDYSENPKKNTQGKKNLDNSSTVSDKSFIIKFNNRKWLPSSHNSQSDFEDSVRKLRSKSSHSRLSTIIQDLSNREKRASKEQVAKKVEETEEFKINRPTTRQMKQNREQKENPTAPKKSVISPIKLDLITKIQTQPSQIINEDLKQMAGISENLNKHKSIHTSNSSPKQSKITKSRESVVNRITLFDNISSPVSTKASSEDMRMNLKRTASITDDSKKKKNHNPTASTINTSTSNVNAWLEKNETTSDKDDDAARLLLVDTLRDVYEKLETTYTEMNTNTNRKLVHVFVEIQKQSEKLEEGRRKMYNEAVKDMIEKICELARTMLADFNNKSKAMNDIFMREFRKSVSDVLLEDSKQRQVAMQILKEDIKAVIAQYQKMGNT